MRATVLRRFLWPSLLLALCPATVSGQQPGITTGGIHPRPIFVRGQVELADGQRLPQKASIELVCQGQAQPQGQTDADGKFNLPLGHARFQGGADASVGTPAAGSGFGGALSGQAQVDGMSVMSLMGCFLRAVLPGYKSEVADLSRVRAGESPDVGVLRLHKIAGGGDSTVSVTSLSAPKTARQALERARQQAARQRYAEAEKELRGAVQLYPKFAEAWQELGAMLEAQKRPAEARRAYLEAAAADERYVKPHLSLARMAAAARDWQETLERSASALKLNPYEFPHAYYYRAVAWYNLDDLDKALESAREAVRLDEAHELPLAEQLLGVIFMARGDYAAAAGHLRNYLRYAPQGANTKAAQVMLAEAEAKLAQSGKP